MVRLKERRMGDKGATKSYFNSTMVRLKDDAFQDYVDFIRHFNSTMVRLKENVTASMSITLAISIPLWYD